MIDIKYIRQNPKEIKKAIQDKGIALDLNQLLKADQELKTQNQVLQDLQKNKNHISSQFKTVQSREEKQLLSEKGKHISREIQQLKTKIILLKEKWDEMMLKVPTPASPLSPRGPDSRANKVIKVAGDTDSSFKKRNHVDLLALHNWSDLKRITSVSGSRTYCLKNEAVLLEQALINWGMHVLREKGFSLYSLPNFAGKKAFIGSGHFPESEQDVYYMERDHIYLTGTAEVILNSLYQGEILDQSKLPLLLAGFSPCFRREAGQAGKAVRGLLRVHQFIKLEQFVICENEKSHTHKWHDFLLNTSEGILKALEIPYRVVLISTGDMGAGKYLMHDLESWSPSLEAYIETHSCSSLLDWQARRTNLRYRTKTGKDILFCHTLNNTALALPRLLAMFLENNQTESGQVKIPHILRPYLNGKALLP